MDFEAKGLRASLSPAGRQPMIGAMLRTGRRRNGRANVSAAVVTWAWVAGCAGGQGGSSPAPDSGDGLTTLVDGAADEGPDAPFDPVPAEDRAMPGAADATHESAATLDAADTADRSDEADTADGALAPVTDIETYCHRFAERSCASSFACAPQTARSTESDCVTETGASCLEAAHAWQIPGVTASRLVFDPASAAACLDGSDKGPCGLAWSSEQACRRVFLPRVPNGGACLKDTECVGRICDRTRTCPGVCASPGQPGDDCSLYPCDADTSTCGPPAGQTRRP